MSDDEKKSGFSYSYLMEISKYTSWDYEYVYGNWNDLLEKFENGEIDGVVATDNNIPADEDYSLVSSVGKEPFYLAVTKTRPDLLKQLNDALSTMQQMDPYFLQNLLYTSYGTTLSNSSLTDAEKEWLSDHDILNIGYIIPCKRQLLESGK